MNGTWKFFTVEVNPVVDGDCDAFIAFQTLDPTATVENVHQWMWDGSHGFACPLDEEDDHVEVAELTREQFEDLTLGQITGHVVDNRRYPKLARSRGVCAS